jgi:hypothetical protein
VGNRIRRGLVDANITSFSLSTGLANWNYQAPSQTVLSLVSYSDGGGLVGKMTTTSGIDTVLRFDSGGNATSDSWTASNSDYSSDNEAWFGSSIILGIIDYSAQSVDPAPSLFPAPKQKRSNRAYPISVKVNFGPTTRNVGDGGDQIPTSFFAPLNLLLVVATSTSFGVASENWTVLLGVGKLDSENSSGSRKYPGIRIGSETRSLSAFSLQESRSNEFRSSSDIRALGLLRSTTTHGYALGRSNWRQI